MKTQRAGGWEEEVWEQRWGQGCRKARREVGGDDLGPQGSREYLSFHLNTLGSPSVTFQVELYFLGSPAAPPTTLLTVSFDLNILVFIPPPGEWV